MASIIKNIYKLLLLKGINTVVFRNPVSLWYFSFVPGTFGISTLASYVHTGQQPQHSYFSQCFESQSWSQKRVGGSRSFRFYVDLLSFVFSLRGNEWVTVFVCVSVKCVHCFLLLAKLPTTKMQ